MRMGGTKRATDVRNTIDYNTEWSCVFTPLTGNNHVSRHCPQSGPLSLGELHSQLADK